MKIHDAMLPPGSLVRKMSPRAMLNALVHALPGTVSGGLPFIPLWLGLDSPLLLIWSAVFSAVALALAVGFWKYQRWEDKVITDWSFIQWGEFVTGATLGTVVMVGLLIYTYVV